MGKGVAGCIGKKGAIGCAGAKGWGGCKQGIICGECEYAVGDTIELVPPTWVIVDDWDCVSYGPDPDAIAAYPPDTTLLGLLNAMPATWTMTITAITPDGSGGYIYDLAYSGAWPTTYFSGQTASVGTMGISWYFGIPGHSPYTIGVQLNIRLQMLCVAGSPDEIHLETNGTSIWGGVIDAYVSINYPNDPGPGESTICGTTVSASMARVTIDAAAECRALHTFDWGVAFSNGVTINDPSGSIQVLP